MARSEMTEHLFFVLMQIWHTG